MPGPVNRPWDEMNSPISPPHPLPYRQPSYSAAQKHLAFSPPPSSSAQGSVQVAEEEDDGGWGVDYNPSGNKKRGKMARGVETSSFGIMLGTVPPIKQAYQDKARSASPAQQEARSVPALAQTVETYEPEVVQVAEKPTAEEGTNSTDQQIANVLLGSGIPLTGDILSRLKQLLDNQLPPVQSAAVPTEQAPAPHLPPHAAPSVPSATSQVAMAGADSSTPASAASQSVIIGGEYNGPIGAPPPGVRHGLFDPNRVALPNLKWGRKTPEVRQSEERLAPFSSSAAIPPPPTGVNGHTAFTSDQIPHPSTVHGHGADDTVSDGGWMEDAKTPTPAPVPTLAPAFAPTRTRNRDPHPTPAPAPAADYFSPNPTEKSLPHGGWAPELQAQAQAIDDTTPDGGWDPKIKVLNWARDVSPPSALPHTPPPIIRDEADASVFLPGASVSDGESGADTDLPTPGREVRPLQEFTGQGYTDNPPAPTSTVQSLTIDMRTHQSTEGEARAPRPRKHWERSDAYYKRDPHPAFSVRFANKRILVRFPYAIRRNVAKKAMYDHFLSYGSIRMVWFHELYADESCSSVLLVFDDEGSAAACLADPKHAECYIQPDGSRSEPILINLHISLSPRYLLCRTICVRLSGQRPDSRSRSASPPCRARAGTDIAESESQSGTLRHPEEAGFNMQPLPSVVHIDAVPRENHRTRLPEFWARVRPQGDRLEDVQSKTSKAAVARITSIEFGRRIAEKDIIPRLCEIFVEIVHIVPPTQRRESWLVALNGRTDARSLMDELMKIPGITTHWAPDGVGLPDDDTPPYRPSAADRVDWFVPDDKGVDGGRSHAEPESKPEPRQPHVDSLRNPDEQDPAAKQSRPSSPPLQISAASTVAPRSTVAAAPTSPSSPVLEQAIPTPLLPADEIDPQYPHLRKRIIPIYRGRTLREDLSGETPSYVDDAAVFAGRIVKESETEHTLFERFSRYGQICGIEYNPLRVQTTYATARILYSSKAAADRALQFEQGAISFGSMLKVEKRRVLASDVQLEERYIDEWGRAYSPSMVSQYSPPQRPVEDDLMFVQPPPLFTPPPMFPPPQQMQWIPFPPPPGMQGPVTDGLAQGPPQSFPPFPFPPGHQQGGGQSGPHSHLMPVLYAMGVGYYPPPNYPQPPHMANGPGASEQLPTPPVTPFFGLFPAGPPLVHTGPSQAPNDPTPDPPAPHQPPPTLAEPTSPSGRLLSPRIIETKMNNGTFTVIYDEIELKRWREERGIAEPHPREDGPLPASHSVAPAPGQEYRPVERDLSNISIDSLNLGGSATPTADASFGSFRTHEQQLLMVQQQQEQQAQGQGQRVHALPVPFSPPRGNGQFSPEAQYRPSDPSYTARPNGNGHGFDNVHNGFGNGFVNGNGLANGNGGGNGNSHPFYHEHQDSYGAQGYEEQRYRGRGRTTAPRGPKARHDPGSPGQEGAGYGWQAR